MYNFYISFSRKRLFFVCQFTPFYGRKIFMIRRKTQNNQSIFCQTKSICNYFFNKTGQYYTDRINQWSDANSVNVNAAISGVDCRSQGFQFVFRSSVGDQNDNLKLNKLKLKEEWSAAIFFGCNQILVSF